MTATRIRYILSGLKSEIRRETDRDRRISLAITGLYWNDLLLNGVEKRTCCTCKEPLPLRFFRVRVINLRGLVYRILNKECKTCFGKKDYVKRKYRKSRKKLIFSEEFNC
jgi:hypothetical protein